MEQVTWRWANTGVTARLAAFGMFCFFANRCVLLFDALLHNNVRGRGETFWRWLLPFAAVSWPNGDSAITTAATGGRNGILALAAGTTTRTIVGRLLAFCKAWRR